MPKIHRISLSREQGEELEHIRDEDPLPYLRERVSAILKIADGQSGLAVARHGLLKPRHPDTVYEWVHGYPWEGVEGLRIKPGRGRKPRFSPSIHDGGERPRRAVSSDPT